MSARAEGFASGVIYACAVLAVVFYIIGKATGEVMFHAATGVSILVAGPAAVWQLWHQRRLRQRLKRPFTGP